MRIQTLSTFASSPLITPKRLRENRKEALAHIPPWVGAFALVGDEEDALDIAEDKVAIVIGSSHSGGESTKVSARDESGGPRHLPVVSYAILCEITRYGNSVYVGSNRGTGRKDAFFDLELSLSGDGRTHFPVGRIIRGAGRHVEVKLSTESSALRRDLHPDNLSEVEGGKPKKDARAVAIHHSIRRAEKAGLSEAEISAYVDNLRSLFAYHDELYGLA